MRRAVRVSRPALGVVVGGLVGNAVGSVSMINATFGVFLVPVTTALGWPRASFSVVLLIMSIMGVIGYPIAGRLADRFGVRRVALIGNVLFALSVAALFFCTSQRSVVYGLYVVVGLTATLPSAVVLAKPISLWFSKHRGLLYAVTTAFGINVGAALMQVVTAALISDHGWRWAYVGIATIILLAGFPALLLLKDPPMALQSSTGAPASIEGMSLRDARRTPAFWFLLAGITLGAGSLSATILHIVPILTDRRISLTEATTVFAAMTLFNATWQIFMGMILDRTNTPRIAAVFLAISLAGLFILDRSSNSTTLILGGVLLGIGAGTEYALLPLAVQRYFGAKSFSEIYGVIFGISILMSGFTPILMDLVFDRTGEYRIALIMVGVAISCSAALISRMPTYRATQSRIPALGKTEAEFEPTAVCT